MNGSSSSGSIEMKKVPSITTSSSHSRRRNGGRKAKTTGDNDSDDDESMEGASLLGYGGGGRNSNVSDDDSIDDGLYGGNSFKFLVKCMILVLFLATLALFLPGIFSKSDSFQTLRTPSRIPVTYECPATIGQAENFDKSFEEDYVEVSKRITDNMTEFLETFRTTKFDDWGRPYEKIKNGMYHWKSTKYPQYLKDGDSIYESACGIGLNLYMTLEILKETKGIENLYVYGNEYVDISAYKANAVFDNIAPAHAKKGVICPGDSGNLFFVPSNSFDLVYTGYISPILDPLHFDLPTLDDNYKRLDILCKAHKQGTEDWKLETLYRVQDQKQKDWYGNWIKEMTRIAKPGVPVIVEQISVPYCEEKRDWGGVNQKWFKDAVYNNTYGWNVQPDSLEFEKDTIFHNRYHAFMLKNEE